MAEKKQKNRDKSAHEYYGLKTGAVERLVNTRNAPKVSEAEIRKYSSGKRFHIPAPVKIAAMKFWFAGAACFFFLWGLGIYIQGLDLLAALAIGLGLMTDLMLNRILRSMEPEDGAYNKWIMVTTRKYYSIFLNVVYSAALLYCIFQTYCIINYAMGVNASAAGSAESPILGVGPILFGLFYMIFDLICIAIKNTFISIIHDAGVKASAQKK